MKYKNVFVRVCLYVNSKYAHAHVWVKINHTLMS